MKIEGISYECFGEIMKYLYTGKFEYLESFKGGEKEIMEAAIEFLRVADVEVLDDVKVQCELKLISILNAKNFALISEAAEKYNADRLKEFCGWFQRTQKEMIDF